MIFCVYKISLTFLSLCDIISINIYIGGDLMKKRYVFLSILSVLPIALFIPELIKVIKYIVKGIEFAKNSNTPIIEAPLIKEHVFFIVAYFICTIVCVFISLCWLGIFDKFSYSIKHTYEEYTQKINERQILNKQKKIKQLQQQLNDLENTD